MIFRPMAFVVGSPEETGRNQNSTSCLPLSVSFNRGTIKDLAADDSCFDCWSL